MNNDPVTIERLTLKLAIDRHLRKWVKKHASMLANDLRGVAQEKPDLFNSVIDEMEQEGLLIKEIGSKGALILVYRSVTEQSLCQKS